MINRIYVADLSGDDRRILEADGITDIYFGEELADESVDWCVSVEGTEERDFYEAWDAVVSDEAESLIKTLIAFEQSGTEHRSEEIGEDEDVYGYLIRYAKGA